MRQSFEILEIFGFWREISIITHTRLEYVVTHTSPECFSRQKNRPCRGLLQFIILYGIDILETQVWEANEDQR